MNKTTFLFLAGYGNSIGDHWQARWFRQFPNSIWVEQQWDEPNKNEWVANIQSCLLKTTEPVVVIAHSLGGLALVEWVSQFAEHAQEKILGAFLVATPDSNADVFPSAIQGFSATPMTPLNIPSLMVVSANDPYCSEARAVEFADAWGANLIRVGPKGHINLDAGLGDWPEGERYLQAFLASLQ